MHSLRVAVKVIIGFLFSLTLILTFLTVSLFGAKAEDAVRLIVTEATGLRRDMVVLQAVLRPMVIHNVFWLCLAAIGFMLIVLYFMDHKFKVLMAPGVLTLSITAFLGIMLAVLKESIYSFTGPVTLVYVQTAFDRFGQAAVWAIVFGIILIILSQWGDQILSKIKKD
ncbi:MAG TPA: hypothetical protein ENN91_01350 [Firmicutes bacterium]|nr:hypothetical protein [Bacillota bacterium]